MLVCGVRHPPIQTQNHTNAHKRTLDVHRAVVGGLVQGFDGLTYLSSCELYDPATDSWCSLPPMNTCRARMQLLVHNDVVYALGGTLGGSLGSYSRLMLSS